MKLDYLLFNSIILDVKEDLKSADNISELVLKAKDIIFDENIQKTIKEFIMIVEEMNRIAKAKGKTYLSGDEKKKAVITRLTEWVSNLTGSVDNAIDFVDSNQTKLNQSLMTILRLVIRWKVKIHSLLLRS